MAEPCRCRLEGDCARLKSWPPPPASRVLDYRSSTRCDEDILRPNSSICGKCREARHCPTTVLGAPGGVPFFLRQILLVCTVFYSICIPSSLAVSVHRIDWNAYSPILGLANDTVVRVKEDDKIKFVCPSRSHEIALYWSTKRKDFDECNGQHSLFACNTSDSFEVHVTEFQWLPGLPSFYKGHPVYFIGRRIMCKYYRMRLIAIFDDDPEPKKTPRPKSSPKSSTVQVQRPTSRATTDHVTRPQRPKTSANVQRSGSSPTTRSPKSGTVKKSVPMLNTSRAGLASLGRAQTDRWAVARLTAGLSLLHLLALR